MQQHQPAARANISPTPSPIPSPGSATRQVMVNFNVPNPPVVVASPAQAVELENRVIKLHAAPHFEFS